MKKFLIAVISLSISIVSCALLADMAAEHTSEQTGDIEVHIEGFRNDNGLADVVLFNAKDGFPADKGKGYRQLTAKIENGRADLVFEAIPHGRYAVSVTHDEDSDGKLKVNFIGIPKEGVTASNNAKGSFGPPTFDDAAFKLEARRVSISMKIQY